jgi:DNA polymerase/3'-5' exonuclease PolX
MEYKGEINQDLLLNILDKVNYISYSMKIKNFLNYISSIIYSSQDDIYNKFNNISSDTYFTDTEKEEFLKSLLFAGYNCANSDIIEYAKLKKNKSKIKNLINEVLPILKMKINLNDTSMLVIDFYLIERGDYVRSVASAETEPKEIKLPFHFSMRLAPHNININSSSIECSKFGDYDNSININNRDNNYGIPHVTFECYNEKSENPKKGGMLNSDFNKDKRADVNIAPDLNMFSGPMNYPTNPAFQGMNYPTNPAFQGMNYPMNPAFQGMPQQMNPAFQRMPPQMNPAFQRMPPPTDPAFQGMPPPQMNPSFQRMPPPTDPAFQGMPPQMNPAFQGMPPQMNPEFLRMPPPTDPAFLRMPPQTDPAFQGISSDKDKDINVSKDPIIENNRKKIGNIGVIGDVGEKNSIVSSRDVEVKGNIAKSRGNIGVIGNIGEKKSIVSSRDVEVKGNIGKNIGNIGVIGDIRDRRDVEVRGNIGVEDTELYKSDDKREHKEINNLCNDYRISHISRNNHAYLYVFETVPYINFFSYFINLLSNKSYVSNISDLINIEKTEDTDDISCIQRNNGSKALIEIYINMALNAVVKLLTAYKNYYDSTILKILKDPINTKDKLVRYINSVESSTQREEKGISIFKNNAMKFELQVLNNLLCSIDADKDYKKYLDLSVKLYDEYFKKKVEYEESILNILTKTNLTDINRAIQKTVYNFGELIIKYNMYVVNAIKAYTSYTHMNSIGMEKYSNIDSRVVNIIEFNNIINVVRVDFLDKLLINYYLVLPNNIIINEVLIKNIYTAINNNNLELYLRDLIKIYTNKGTNFNETYIYNIISNQIYLYFNQLAEIVINKNTINEETYHSNLESLKDKYALFINIIIVDEKFQKVYNYKKSYFIKKYKKIDNDIEKYLSNIFVKKEEPVRRKTPVIKSKTKSARGGMPPKKIKSIDYRQHIISNLKILADYEKLNKEPFKTRAYNKVIESVETLEEPINNLEEFKKIKGVGDKIALKIKELIETGKITAVEEALKDPRFSLQKQLGKLYGVGPVKIAELMNNIKSFDELYKNPDLLNDKQKIGLKYYKDMEMRIPISEGKKHYKIIDKIFKLTNDKIEFELVGSYRRKNKDMGDIDILIKNSEDLILKKLIANLVESGYIIETLASGKSKFMGLCKLSPDLPARRIDILIAEPSYYYFALLYFTGSYSFNIYMRKIALEKGYSLSEYGLKGKDNKIIDTSDIIKSEEDIFKFLNIPYVTPEKRNIV